MPMTRPRVRPTNPNFASGPCPKPPDWTLDALGAALVGRSHRSRPARQRLGAVIEKTREILGIPDDYRIAIVPASGTGAVEMALWSLLGSRPVEVLAWESFGRDWLRDITGELRIEAVRAHLADYGELPDLSLVDFDHDVVFAWNGTTSGVRVPDGGFIPRGRKGLTICDATSAVFAQRLDWQKLDATTFSWQKVLGGEAAHGMLVLSPRAVRRLETWKPPWPVPKIFRLAGDGTLDEGLFRGATINTPSMLCVEDFLAALHWAHSLGGLAGTMALADSNFGILANHVAQCGWLGFLARDPATRSNTSVCLVITDPDIAVLEPGRQADFAKRLAGRLEEERVAFDIAAYRDAPPGLRIWTGSTVRQEDLQHLLPWLDWAFEVEREAFVRGFQS